MTEDDFLRAIAEDPASAQSTRLVLADWLEENGQAERAELVRLQHDRGWRPESSVASKDARVRELLATGVAPVVPTLVNSIGMRFVLIPAGSFLMGSPKAEEERDEDEGPQHRVTLTRPFWMGAFAVTQQEYRTVMGVNPSCFWKKGSKSPDRSRFPVESVSWEDAVAFCDRLSGLPAERAARRRSRLPTEAEWEYACRAGASDGAPFHFGWSLSSEQANFDGTLPYGGASEGPNLERTVPVRRFTPNAWGLYDMHGNVCEWCADWDGDYPAEEQADPTGPAVGDLRVLRGGSWFINADDCRAAYRFPWDPAGYGDLMGFRVCFRLDRP